MTSAINASSWKLGLALVQQPAMKFIHSSTDSVSRLVSEKVHVARTMNTSPLRRHFDKVTKPPSLSGGMQKAGIALIAAPDPITCLPGVALLASSFAVKRREPASLVSLAQEARNVLRELQSLSL